MIEWLNDCIFGMNQSALAVHYFELFNNNRLKSYAGNAT